MREYTSWNIGWPDDFHVHLRRSDMLRAVIRYTARCFRRALIMPNTEPDPVLTAEDAVRYREEILQAAKDAGCPDFEPLMAIQITDDTTPEMIRAARQAGVVAGKMYLKRTTNARHGVGEIRDREEVFQAMEDARMVLCVHGEATGRGVHVLNAEERFLPTLEWLSDEFPGLKIVLEHITTKAAVEAVRALPANVAATITAHHLVLLFEDVMGDRVRPQNFCKPVAKLPDDRRALRNAATSGNPKFFFGSDSAPHPHERKFGSEGWPGVFSAPTALSIIIDLFMRLGAPGRIEPFLSQNGATFYDLPFNTGKIEFVQEGWAPPLAVPDTTIPIFRGGTRMGWLMK